MPHVRIGDIDVYHEVHGDGPPLLHISGSGNDLRDSAPHASPLNRRFTGLHYDQRGLGRTGAGDRQPTMVDFADDAAGLCAALGWRRCHVVGTSFGGMVAQHLALRHPELVDRLVLACTSPGGAFASYPLHELEALDPATRTAAWLPLMDTRHDPDADEPIPGFGVFAHVLAERMARPVSDEVAAGRARQLEARRHHDVVADLPRIDAPTLVAAGRFDGIAPPANAEALAAGIPGARLAWFDGGHAFMVQDPTAFAVMGDFLADRSR